MNSLESRQLILTLQDKLSQSDHQKDSVESKLTKLFITTFWNSKKVVLRESLIGRISTCLTLDTHREQEIKVKKVFAEAVSQLSRNNEMPEGIPLSLRFELVRILRQGMTVSQDVKQKLNLSSLPELEEIQKTQKEFVVKEKEEQKAKIQEFSLLQQAQLSNSPLDLETFKALFSHKDLTDLTYLDYVINFLQKKGYAHSEIEQKVLLLKKALLEKKVLKQNLMSKGKPLPLEERKSKIVDMAKKLVVTAEQLKPNERWMFCENYGERVNSAISFVQTLLKKLPTGSLNSLPDCVSNFCKTVDSTKLPDPKEYVDAQLHQAFENLKKEVPDFSQQTAVFDLFLGNNTSKCPDHIAQAIPTFLSKNIESWIQQGLLGNVSEFVSDGPFRDYILWITQNQQLFRDVNKKDEFLKAIEEKAKQFINNPLTNGINAVDDQLAHFIKSMFDKLPPQMLQLLGLDNPFVFNSCWIELERQENGKFTVSVYFSGKGFQLHETNSSKSTNWPLRFVDVESSKLNEEFFKRLLFLSTEPFFNSEFTIQAEDLYEGVIKHLGGVLDSKFEGRHGVDLSEATPWETYCNFLTRPETSTRLALFEMRCEALQQLCAPYLVGPEKTLVLDKENVQSAALQAVQELSNEAIALKPLLGDTVLKQLEATKLEISLAAAKAKAMAEKKSNTSDNPLGMSTDMHNTFRTFCQANGISSQKLRSYKDLLIWGFGEEMRDFIEAIIDSIGELPPNVKSVSKTTVSTFEKVKMDTAAIKKHPRGWLGSIFLSVYFRLAIQAFSLAIFLSRISEVGLALLLKPILQEAFFLLIPKTVWQWYVQVMSTIKQKICEMILHYILSTVLKEEDSKKIQALTSEWHQIIQSWTNTFMCKEKLNLELSQKAPRSDFNFIIPDDNPIRSSVKNKNENFIDQWNEWIIYAQQMNYDSHNVVPELSYISSELEKFGHKSWIVYPFLSEIFKKLPVPVTGKQDMWDELNPNDVRKCLDLLSTLAGYFSTNYDLLVQQNEGNNSENTSREYGRFVTDLYTTLAVMDKLARKCPEAKLENYKTNGYQILEWYSAGNAQLDDHERMQRFKQACTYLIPEIDLEHLPPSSEINKLSSQTLFNYNEMSQHYHSFTNSTSVFYFHRAQRLGNKDFQMQRSVEDAIPELRYLGERLKEPETEEKLKEMGCPPNFPTKRKYPALFNLSSNFAQPDPILSNAYKLLRLQTLLLNDRIAAGLYVDNLEEIDPEYRNYFELPPNKKGFWESIFAREAQVSALDVLSLKKKPFRAPVFQQMEKNWRGILNTLKTIGGITQDFAGLWYVEFLLNFKAAFSASNWDQSRFARPYYEPNATRRNQATIMAQPSSTFSAEQEMISAEGRDQIIRTLDYFKKQKATEFPVKALEALFFNVGKLEAQLHDSPYVVEAIGDFFKMALKKYAPTKTGYTHQQYGDLVELAIKIKKYCQAIHPKLAQDHFPDFFELLEEKRQEAKEKPIKGFYQMLQALTFDLPSIDQSIEYRQKAVLHFCQVVFHSPITLDNVGNIKEKFKTNYRLWWPQIKVRLEDSDFAKEAFSQILKIQGVTQPEAGDWRYLGGADFAFEHSKSNTLVSFARGLVQQKDTLVSCFLFKDIQEQAKEHIPNYKELRLKDRTYSTPNEDFSIHITEQDHLVFKRKIGEKSYRLCSSHKFPQGFFKLGEKDAVWIEETSNTKKEILIYRAQKQINSFSVIRHDPNSLKYKLDTADNNVAYQVEAYSLKRSLAPLTRFCPLSETECWGQPSSGYLQKIHFKPYDLTFNVEKEDQPLEKEDQPPLAYCSSIPGYYIAASQDGRRFDDFASYLLLENSSHQRKILLPDEQWMASALWRGAMKLGPFAHLASNWLTAYSQNKKCHVHIYDIDEKGNLTSEDPAALIYLITLYLIQGKSDKALKVCEQFEMACRLKGVPQSLSEALFPMMLIPSDLVKNISVIRQRLLAAIGESSLVRHVDSGKKAKDGTESKWFIDLLFAMVIMQDLQEGLGAEDSRYKLNDYQQWFIFQHLHHSVQKFVEKGNVLPNYALGVCRNLGWDFFLENLGFSPELSARYHELKARFGKDENFLVKTLNVGHEIYSTPTNLPTLNLETLSLKKEQVTEETKGKDLIPLLRMVGKTFTPELDVDNVSAAIDTKIVCNPPLTVEELDAKTFKHYFLSYYAIAYGEGLTNKIAKYNPITMLQNGVKQLNRHLVTLNPPKVTYSNAYAISTQQKKLAALLPLIKGGWDKDTRILVEYLEETLQAPTTALLPFYEVEYPKLFLNQLKARLYSLKTFKKGTTIAGSQVINFAKRRIKPNLLAFPLASIGMGTTALHVGAKAYNWYQQKNATSATSNTAQPNPLQAPQQSSYEHLEKEDAKFDTLLDQLFDFAFEPAEKPSKDEKANEEKAIASFPESKNDTLAADRIKRVNESLDDFYHPKDSEGKRGDMAPRQYTKLKDLECVYDLYLNAVSCQDGIEQQLNADREALLQSLNSNDEINEPITIEEVQKAFLHGDYHELCRIKKISLSLIPKMELLMARYLTKQTRLQQLQRVVRHVESLIDLDPKKDEHEYGNKLQLLVNELRARRAYSFKEVTPKLVRRLLLFEALTDKMIWKKQAPPIIKALQDHHGNVIIELLMSYGKTYFGIPTIDSHEADGEQIVFNIFPKQLFNPNVKQTSKQGKEIFNQSTNTFQFDRSTPLTKEKLEAILIVLDRALAEKETINMTKESAQALELIFIDHLYNATHDGKNNSEMHKILLKLQSTLRLILEKGLLVGDEAHELLKEMCELNYPIGPGSKIDPVYIRLTEACYSAFASDPKTIAILKDKSKETFPLDYYKSTILPALAYKMSLYAPIKIPAKSTGDFLDYLSENSVPFPSWVKENPKLFKEIALFKKKIHAFLPVQLTKQQRREFLDFIDGKNSQPDWLKEANTEEIGLLKKKLNHLLPSETSDNPQQDFIDYVCGKTETIPDWIEKSAHFEEIALVKGILTVLLPLSLSRRVGVDYGASKQGKTRYARPFEGNESPLENSTIKSPYEAMAKTFTQFLVEGLRDDEFAKLTSKLRQKAKKEMKKRDILAEKTETYKTYSELFPGRNLMTSDVDPITEEMKQNPSAALLYLHYFEISSIEFWLKSIKSVAVNFISMFHSRILDTGSPYNEGTYPHILKMLWDPGTIGEALHIINQKCPENGIHVLEATSPKDILKETLETYFQSGSRFSALIDGGAQLRGLDNETVALQMAEFVKAHRPDIKVIDYFKKDQKGEDQLVSLVIKEMVTIPHETCNVPLKERLSYFDDRHGFGANIPSRFDGKGLNLLSKTHALYRLLQEVFRMRGIKVFNQLIGFGNILSIDDAVRANLENTQTIEFAMTKDVQKAITGQDILPALKQIAKFAAENEKDLAWHNYQAYRQQIQDVVRRAVLTKIEFAKSANEMIKLFAEFEHVLVSELEIKPSKLFGYIETMSDIERVITDFKAKAYGTIKSSSYLSADEKQTILDKINKIPQPVMPAQVTIFTNGKEYSVSALDDLEKEVSQEVNHDQDVEEEQDQDQDQELENEQNTTIHRSYAPYFEETGWQNKINPFSLEWLQFHKIATGSLIGFEETVKGSIDSFKNPPLFQVCHLLESAKAKSLNAVANAFDKRLWFSNNFLPTIVTGWQSVEIGSEHQRPLYEVLVHLEEKEDGSYQVLSMGALSQHDADCWREKLEEGKQANAKGKIKAVLYDVSSRKIVKGSEVNQANLLKNRDFIQLEAQMKFLNGDFKYHDDQIVELIKWLLKMGVEKMRSGFTMIYNQRKKGKSILETDIDYIFAKLEAPAA